MRKSRTILCLGILTVALASSSMAANIYPVDDGGTHSYTNPASWALGAVPLSSDYAYIRFGATMVLDAAIDVAQIRSFESGTVVITNGANVTVPSQMLIGAVAGSPGNLTMSAGSLDATRLTLGYNAGGTSKISGGDITAAMVILGHIAGAGVNTTQTGGTVKSGSTDVNFSAAGDSTYALNGGTFQTIDIIFRYGNAANPNPFTMGGNGTLKTTRLKFRDTWWAAVSATFVQDGGILDPTDVDNTGEINNEIARLSVLGIDSNTNANYTMGLGATLAMQIGGTNDAAGASNGYDQVNVVGTFTEGGTLDATLVNGFVPEEGDQFDLLDAHTFVGAFDTINLPSLPEGLAWYTDDLAIDGSMHVGSSETAATIIRVTPISGTVLELEVNANFPDRSYPKAASVLLMNNTVWESVGHSTNGLPPFEITNLDYSVVSGTNFLIYVEADQEMKFFKVGAE